MKTRNIHWGLMALGTCAALLSTSAHAVWTFTTTGSPTANTYSYAGTGANSGDAAVSLTGFYVANTMTSGKLNSNWASAAGTVGTAGIANSSAGVFSHGSAGMGMYTGTDNAQPQHALDNSQFTEAVLLNFGASTVLTSIGLGYVDNTASPSEIGCRNNTTQAITVTTGTCGAGTTAVGDTADVSVFRWIGDANGPTPGTDGVAGTNGGTMGSWELVGNYGDMVSDTSNPYNNVNASGKTSSWWLISAYNSGFKQNTTNSSSSIATENRATLTDGDDFFKLYAVAGTKCTSTVDAKGVCGGTTSKTPEPATLALTSVALIGVAGLRRRKAKFAA